MKQRLALAVVAMLAMTIVGTAAVSAHRPTLSLGARVTPADAGGSIHVQAKALHATRGTTFSAVAVATFASGDVTVNLRRAGRSFVAVGKIPVPADQPAGPVTVVVTITYGGVDTPFTRTSQISLADPTP